MVSDGDLPHVRIHRNVIQRLDACASGNYSGCLYGVPAGSAPGSDHLVWSATGKEREGEEELQGQKERRDLEVLTEILPCGVDPLGVFVVDKEQEVIDEQTVHELIEQLPDAFLEATDPVVLTRNSKGEFNVFLQTEGRLEEVPLQVAEPGEFEKECQVVRVRGGLTLVSLQTESDLQVAFKHLIEKVSCPYGTFRLEDSDVFFIHVWETKRRVQNQQVVQQASLGSEPSNTQTGWAGADIFDEDEETCHVTNLDEEAEVISDLWRFVKSGDDDDEDDGFGPKGAAPKRKTKVEEKETLNFKLFMKMSGEACSSKTLNCAPVVYYEKKEQNNVRIPIKIDALGVVRKTTKIPDLMEVLKGCVQRQIHEMGRSVLSELKMRGTSSLPEVFHLKPEPLGHLCTMIYNKRGQCAGFAEFRRHIHRLFLLPVDRPLFRRMNRHLFPDDLPSKGALLNVHLGLRLASATGDEGQVHLVQGRYAYHHYMQDGFDDDGWGCAYRSLQTIVSWFRLQGYSATEVPTHAQIQKCLVDIGDKEAKFVGSKQWIGSTEVGFVVEKACEVQSRFLSVSSGDEMPTKSRELVHHFQTHGSPVMIGGGVLAHTIIGVDWNESTGETRWLILDPHFTGSDRVSGSPNTPYMQQKGWVGWKGVDFWKKGAFYNMCLPQRPKQW